MRAAIIGREKKLAYAELESVFESITIEDNTVFVDTENAINLHQLGSVIKTTNNLTPINLDANSIALYIASKFQNDKKLLLALSFYPPSIISPKNYKKLVFEVKKILHRQNYSIRVVMPKTGVSLSSAQTHNYISKNYCELIFVRNNSSIQVSTIAEVQDITAYSLRDYHRPCRDAKVGMFPPKLAQIIINLSTPGEKSVIIDPFCGSGVVLQEAILMGYNVQGSDIEQRMIECTKTNLSWLTQKFASNSTYQLKCIDARKLTINETNYCIVTEGYLGTPLSNRPTIQQINQLRDKLSPLYRNFIVGLSKQSAQPQRIVITSPLWRANDNSIQTLKALDQPDGLGYTRVQFKSVDSHNLHYIRDNQIVGRQIHVLTPK